MRRRFRFGPILMRCRKCDHKWKPAKIGPKYHCPSCAHKRVEMAAAEATESAEDEVEDADEGELIPERQWTDSQGRNMTASLRTVVKNDAGYFVGMFIREDGIGFRYQIGNLGTTDVDLVRQTMIDQDLYDPADMA